MPPGEIERLSRPGRYPLLVRLAGGATAEVPMAEIAPRVEARAAELARAGAALVVVLCAGDFPRFPCAAPLLLPGAVLPAVAASLAPSRRVGIVTPVAGQVPFARAKWRQDGFDPVVTSAPPDAAAGIEPAARLLRDPGLELVVLDCMGHDESYREAFALRCGRPVLSAQTLVARLAGALLPPSP